MSNICPVCQKESTKIKCENCGFEKSAFAFLSEDDINKWYEDTVLPYKEVLENMEKKKNNCEHCGKEMQVEWIACPYCGKNKKTNNCEKCGKEMKDEWIVCPYCGKSKKKNNCMNCGEEMQDEWSICPYCGTSVKPAVKKSSAAKKTEAAKVDVIEQAAPAVNETQAAPVKETAEGVEVLDSNIKYRNLFDAFNQRKLPFVNGYIVSSFFSETSAYSIYEVVSYAGVKEIFPTETGLQFTTGGKKLYILVEPATYQGKFMEPVSRSNSQGERIPKRFSELEIIIAKNQTKIMIAKEPDETYGSFTILKPQGQNFAVLFYQLPDVYVSMASFFKESLNRQRKIPEADAKKAAAKIAEIVEKYMGFKGQFG